MDLLQSIYIPLIIFFLFCSAFFSGSETALFSLGRWKLIRLKEEGHPKYGLIDELLANPRRLLISIIIGNDVSNIVASALATPIAVRYFGRPGRWIAIAVMTTIIIILCDIIPKVLAISHPSSFSSFIARPIAAFLRWIAPIRWLIQWAVDGILDAVGLPKKKPNFLLEKDFLRLVEHGHRAGALDRLERDFIKRVVDFSDTKVTAIMTPRLDIFALAAETKLSAAIEQVKKRGYSRVPVYENDINNIIGILHIKDLLDVKSSLAVKTEISDIRSRLKPVCYVPETKKVDNLFRDLQARRIHLAVVVDEYGDVTGLVTMEDVLEELFGEIYDEYDQRGVMFEEKGKGIYLVSPRMLIEDFNEVIGANIPLGQVETIGGFVLNLFGELPREGHQAAYGGLLFTVTKLRGTSLLQLKVERKDQA